MTSLPPLTACRVRCFRNGETALVTLTGVLRMHESERIKRMILTLFDGKLRLLLLHLGSLDEIDSAGLGVLVGLHMTARNHQCEMKLLAPNEYQLRLFQATRLNTLLTVVNGGEAEQWRQQFQIEEYAIQLIEPPPVENNPEKGWRT